MTRMVATRVSDEAYTKIMGKCAGLGCSVYDYLKMLVETDTTDTKQTRETNENNKQPEPERKRNATQEVNELGITDADAERLLQILKEGKTES